MTHTATLTPTPLLVKTSLQIYCSYCHCAVHFELKEKQLVQLQESTLHFIKRDDPSIMNYLRVMFIIGSMHPIIRNMEANDYCKDNILTIIIE